MEKSIKNMQKQQSRKSKHVKKSKGIATNFAKSFDVPKKWFEEVKLFEFVFKYIVNIMIILQLSKDPKDFAKVTDNKLIELKEEAKKCHDSDVATYNISM